MKALVVGGAGFIGSHLCDALLNGGHEVSCVDNLSLGTRENINHLIERSCFRFHQADAAEGEVLEEIFQKEKPDFVFHLAANSDIQASAENPAIEYRNTYSTTFQILSCMRRNGVKKLFLHPHRQFTGTGGKNCWWRIWPSFRPFPIMARPSWEVKP